VSAQHSHEGGPGGPSAHRGGADPLTAAFDRSYTVDQAARILGTSSTTVRRLMTDDLIAHQRVSPRRIVIRESAIRAYLDAVTQGPCP
jgi:excisionase family DNA binding protein